MILPGGVTRAYLATRPVDFRKGHAGLALVVQNVLGHDPYNGAVYLFRSKRGDQLKCLVWDQTGLIVRGRSNRWRGPLTLQEAQGRRLCLAEAGGRGHSAVPGAILRPVRG